MNNLLKVFQAISVADLPPVCRSFWEDDEDFGDNFGFHNDDTKCDYLASAMKKALELNIRNDNDFLRLFMMCIKCEEDDYEDKSESEEPEEQHVVIPVLQVEQPKNEEIEKLKQDLANAQQELAKLRAQTIQTTTADRTEDEDKEDKPKRGRGRPPKNPNNDFHKCLLCKVGCASAGSLYNHYLSKPHSNHILDILEKAKVLIQANPETHYRIKVKVRSHLDDPNLTTEFPTIEDLDNIKSYVEDKYNPIVDIVFSEKTKLSWKLLLG